MDADSTLATRFEAHRPHLRAVGYRLLGSVSDAEDAVQEAWLRLTRADAATIENLGGWLTTVVTRMCLDMLRARRARREESIEVRVPDPVVSAPDDSDPEQAVLLADAVGLALLVALDRLSPAERVAFVLHDAFSVPFEEIATLLERSPAATRQLASRARRRLRETAPPLEPDASRQQAVVDAFVAASRAGDFDALLRVLDPEVTLRVDLGAAPGSREVTGASEVAGLAFRFSGDGWETRTALVNGVPGVVTLRDGRAFSIAAFAVSAGRVTQIDILADPVRVEPLARPLLER